MGGERCPGVPELLESAKQQVAATNAGAAPRGAEQSNGDVANGQALHKLNFVDDRYSWSQTKESVQVNVFVPAGTKAKDVAVEISESALNVLVNKKRLLQGEWEFK